MQARKAGKRDVRHDADAIDGAFIRRNERRSHKTDSLVFEGCRDSFKKIGSTFHIVVQKNDNVAFARSSASIARDGEPVVSSGLHEPNPGKRLANTVRCAVSRRVVRNDHDMFERLLA
jgi:hypothetical protein